MLGKENSNISYNNHKEGSLLSSESRELLQMLRMHTDCLAGQVKASLKGRPWVVILISQDKLTWLL